MVLSIARQAVIIKCLREKSVLVGNYEFYYLAGLMKKLFGLDLTEEMAPQELLDYILGKLPSLKPKNPQEAYLVKLVKYYEPLEAYDQQMKQLFIWGAEEKDVWKVNTSARYS